MMQDLMMLMAVLNFILRTSSSALENVSCWWFDGWEENLSFVLLLYEKLDS